MMETRFQIFAMYLAIIVVMYVLAAYQWYSFKCPELTETQKRYRIIEILTWESCK